MMEFEIKRTSRRCEATQRELKPGEYFYSELVQREGEMQRLDYCQEAWPGPSESSIGWWKARIPKSDSDRVYWAPRDVLIAYFEQLYVAGQKPQTTYVMALLLVRRRVLQFEESFTDEQGRDFIRLFLARAKKYYEVGVESPESAEIARIQGELAAHLFVDQVAEDE